MVVIVVVVQAEDIRNCLGRVSIPGNKTLKVPSSSPVSKIRP